MAARATVVGSGPNGLSAAVALARAGLEVRVLEAAPSIGGGVRSGAATLPGFVHDVCSAVHPAALTSPFFRALELSRHVDWLVPKASYAHPLEGGRAAIAWHDIDRTVAGLGPDGPAWRRLLAPLARRIDEVVSFTGDQLLRMPRHPLTAARFGLRVAANALPSTPFRTDAAAALLTGALAHANTRMPSLASSAAGMLLAAHGHSTGWPVPRGSAQAIADALAADLFAHGGEIETDTRVGTLADLDWGDPENDLLVLDTSPRLLLTAPHLPPRYARAIRRYRYGPAAAKVDFALDGPVPWANPEVSASPTVHLGGTREEILTAEAEVSHGRIPEHPYVLVVQPSVIDPTRAPEGKAVLWAYTHVPLHSRADVTEAITAQIERFAPGFRDLILASSHVAAAEREEINPAEIGGDILGGAFTLTQALRRPVVSRHPWRTPLPGVYLASAATPPGPAVHGMNGWYAARTALRDRTGMDVCLDDLFGGDLVGG
ncbi:NAD(P)/FAD-dependent oxidoreductase [Microbacterium sediminicola]|uniref:Pyridine nucleotide-disulfide oxidoreductase domain-containing protein 2 n=1 Tax=Microbacterium sediminicola TaxID=415210 RepID=A0ABP4TGR4_9MICO